MTPHFGLIDHWETQILGKGGFGIRFPGQPEMTP
jgi:hypothetical protein